MEWNHLKYQSVNEFKEIIGILVNIVPNTCA
jgi:hypothetical protein